MSNTNFKRPPSTSGRTEVQVRVPLAPLRMALDPALSDEEQQVRLMATCIPDEAALEDLLRGADPLSREGMLEMIRPYLQFELSAETTTPDCPLCGLRKGSVIPHECLGAN